MTTSAEIHCQVLFYCCCNKPYPSHSKQFLFTFVSTVNWCVALNLCYFQIVISTFLREWNRKKNTKPATALRRESQKYLSPKLVYFLSNMILAVFHLSNSSLANRKNAVYLHWCDFQNKKKEKKAYLLRACLPVDLCSLWICLPPMLWFYCRKDQVVEALAIDAIQPLKKSDSMSRQINCPTISIWTMCSI